MDERHRNWKKYYEDHKEKRKIDSRSYYARQRGAIFGILGEKCALCGFNDMRALQIDHVRGGGGREKRENTTHTQYYKNILNKLLNGSIDYQILCANCNWIKRCINQENKNRYNYLVEVE